MSKDANVVNYKCPNCGAALTYNIETKGWNCRFCGSQYAEDQRSMFEEMGDSSENILDPYEPELDTSYFSEEEIVSYSCPDCGGQVITEKNTVSTFCAYCHNPTVIAGKLSGVHKPAKIIPFTVPKSEVLDELKKLTRKKILLPSAFKNAIDKGEVTGLYAPFWLFSGDVLFDLRGEGRRISSWSSGDSTYIKTDVYGINRSGNVGVKLVPVDASKRLSDKLMDSIEPYNYAELKDFSMEYLSGLFAETFDVEAKECYGRFSSRTQTTTRELVNSSVGGYNSVSYHFYQADIVNHENQFVMLPVWTITLNHGGKTYSFAMNGQTRKSAGILPFSWGKLAGLFFGVGAVATVIITLISLLMGG